MLKASLRGLNLRVLGYAKLVRELEKLGAPHGRIVEAATGAWMEATEDLLGRAMRDAPLDEGTLRGSGTAAVYVDGERVMAVRADAAAQIEALFPKPPSSRGSIVGIVGFNTPYALRQHEDLSYQHPKGGKAKYLEDPLKENADRYVRLLAQRIREALE